MHPVGAGKKSLHVSGVESLGEIFVSDILLLKCGGFCLAETGCLKCCVSKVLFQPLCNQGSIHVVFFQKTRLLNVDFEPDR